MRTCSLLLAMLLVSAAETPLHAQLSSEDFMRGGTADYDITWDGWRGVLQLRAQGTSTLRTDQGEYPVRFEVGRNPQDPVSGRLGAGYFKTPSTANHRIVFWVDFPRTPAPADDQRFDGYLMTQTKDALAGVTWWENIPFGFYALNRSSHGARSSPSTGTKTIVERHLDSEGRVVLVFSDGSKMIEDRGGSTLVDPDGKKHRTVFQNPPAAILPTFPAASPTSKWLQAHNEALLVVMRDLVPAQDIATYLQKENNLFGNDIGAQILHRTFAIGVLTP
jgi:hypothetical protein